MASPYNSPSPPASFSRTLSTAMPPLTPAQSAAVDKKICAALENFSLHYGSPGSTEPLNIHDIPSGQYTNGNGKTTTKPKTGKSSNWSTTDVGYFVPEQTLDEHTVTENGIVFYQDVWAFINFLRVLAESTDEETIRSNLHYCLREKAFDWYITELTRPEREALRTQPLEEGWFKSLAVRFSPSREVAADQFKRMQYGWTDVRREYPAVVWANTMLRHIQALDRGSPLKSNILAEHLLSIWHALNDDFAKDVPAPNEGTSVAEFMAELDEAYKRWRWVALTGPNNYEPRARKSNGDVDGVSNGA